MESCFECLTFHVIVNACGRGLGWNDNLLLCSESECVFSPAESQSLLLSSKLSSFGGLVFSTFFVCAIVSLVWSSRLDCIISKGHRGNRIKKFWLCPFHADLNQGTQSFLRQWSSSCWFVSSEKIFVWVYHLILPVKIILAAKFLCQITRYMVFYGDKYMTA